MPLLGSDAQLPPTDRAALRGEAQDRLQQMLNKFQNFSGLKLLEQIGGVASEASAFAKTVRHQAYEAAYSVAFHEGVPRLHEVLGVNRDSWLQARRRRLDVATTPFLASASPEEIAARAQQLGVPLVPEALSALPSLARTHVAAEEWSRAVQRERDDLIPGLYSASQMNPGGITQPMLARAAGITQQRVWQLMNKDFRRHRPHHGNKPLYPPRST